VKITSAAQKESYLKTLSSRRLASPPVPSVILSLSLSLSLSRPQEYLGRSPWTCRHSPGYPAHPRGRRLCAGCRKAACAHLAC